jgi:flagellar hook-associated protein 1 FlgK
VSPAIVGNTARIAASQTGAPGDNGTARAIVALREAATVSGGTATFTQGWAQLAFRAGADIDDALSRQQTARDVSAEVQRLRDQVSGVSLDEEAASLIKFQTAYEANAKYFSAVDSALDTLMRLVGA